MYQPPAFREDRTVAQHALIRAHPFGLLVTAGPEGPLASPVPFALHASEGTNGTLRCHLARANPHLAALDGAAALAVFTAADAYVTPSWYASKREHGRVVPTWNYAHVQAHGTARLIDDPAWLAEHVAAITALHEAARPEPWAVTDAPSRFIDAQLGGIVGVEIPIARLEAKVKASQNRPQADCAGVADGLDAESPGSPMAAIVRNRAGR